MKHSSTFFCALLSLLLGSLSSLIIPPAAAQTRDVGRVIVRDFSTSWEDGLHFFSAPARATPADWAVGAGFVGATAALFPADESLNALWLRNRSQANDVWAAVGRTYGDGIIPIALGGALYLGGLAAGDENGDHVRVTGRLMLQSLLYAGLTTITLKAAFGRARPYMERGAFTFQPPAPLNNDFQAFPSGHATVAFAVSTVLSERIGNVWASIGLYALATAAALSRMYHTQHWASDVLLGGTIGTVAGLAVTAYERERTSEYQSGSQSNTRNGNVRPILVPTMNGNGVGIGIAVQVE